jgi:hypothetical protein
MLRQEERKGGRVEGRKRARKRERDRREAQTKDKIIIPHD